MKNWMITITNEEVGILLYILKESIRQNKADIRSFLSISEDDKTPIDLREDAKEAVNGLEENILETEEIIRKIHEGKATE